MSFSDEMTKELEKLKKKQQEIDGLNVESPYEGGNSRPQNNDIAPVVSFGEFINNMGTPEEIAEWQAKKAKKEKEKKKSGGLFDSGAFGDFDITKKFKDGYDFGDITKTILGLGDATVKTVAGTALDIGTEAFRGIWKVGEGLGNGINKNIIAPIMDLTGNHEQAKVIRENVKNNRAGEVFDNFMKPVDDVADSNSLLGRESEELTQAVSRIYALGSIGNTAKALGLGAKGVSVLTTSITFNNSYVSGLQEAYKSGATDEEAEVYGIISGIVDAGSELIFSGLGKSFNMAGFGGKGISSADDMLAAKVTSKMKSVVAKNFTQFVIKAGAEGLEEVIAGFGQALGKKVTYMSEEDFGKILEDENLFEQFVMGALVSGGMQSGYLPGTSEGSLRDANKSGKDFITGLNANEQAVIDKEFNNRVAEAEKNGKLSAKDKNKIYDDVVKALEKGDISIDVIEEVLGGDTYKSYKDTVKSEDALQKEYDELADIKKSELTVKQEKRLNELEKLIEEAKTKSERDFLQKKYKNEAYELAKGSKLEESYNERARRGQAFTADVTKYNDKQRAIVQKAIDSGILNNTNKTHDFVDLVARIADNKGIDFDFLNNAKLKESGFAIDCVTVNGYFDAKTKSVGINLNSAKALNTVVGHEITHVLEGTELYTELQKAVTEYANTKGEYQSRRDALAELYKNVENADIDAELTADLVGDYLFTDADFVNNLSANHRNIFQKIYDEVKYLCKVVTAGSKEARQLEKVKKTFEDAFRAETKNTAQEGGVKYSLTTTTDGRSVAVVDSDILSNIDTTSWDSTKKEAAKKAASDALKKYSGGIVVDGITRKVNRTSRREYTRSNDTERLYKKSPDIFADKMRAADIADDIVVATTNWSRDGGLVHSRKDNFVDFDHGVTLIMSGNSKYQAEVVVGITSNGDAVFYDVVDMTPTTFDIKTAESSTTATTQDAIGDIQEDSANNSIPQNSKKSTQNTKKSLSAQNDDLGPIGDYNVYGKDVALEGPLPDDFAPIGEDTSDAGFTGEYTGRHYNAKQSELLSALPVEALQNAIDTNGNLSFNTIGLSGDVAAQQAWKDAGLTYEEDGRVYVDENAVLDERDRRRKANSQTSVDSKNGNVNRVDTEGATVLSTESTTENEALDNITDDKPIQTVKDKLEARLGNLNTELNNVRQKQAERVESLDKRIADLQAQYDGKSNKDTKAANGILRSIERLKRIRADIVADYGKRISDIESRIERVNGELQKDHSKADRLERAYAKIDRQLEQDKAELRAQYESRKAEAQKTLSDKNGFIKNRANELYWELSNLKKGVRASKELGYLLDHGYNWGDIKTALVNVETSPGSTVNKNSAVESVVREALNREYESRSYELNEIDAQYESDVAKLEAEAEEKRNNARVADSRKVKSQEMREQMEELVGDTSTWRDKSTGLAYKVNTLRRNLRDIVRDENGKRDVERADAIYDELQGKYNRHEAELNRRANAIRKPFAEMKINKYEDVYIQMLGEFRHNPDTTLTEDDVKAYLKQHKDKIDEAKVDKAIERAREVYDQLFDELNAVLREHGMKEIEYRKGYFPHLNEQKQGWLAKLFNWKTRDDSIPTDIAGLTETFEPTRSWQSFNKHRKGDTTDYSFTKGLDKYSFGALDWIYHIEDIQKRRAFENYIRYIHSDKGVQEKIDKINSNDEYSSEEAQEQIDLVYKNAANPLNNFIVDFRTATNTLAGKKSSMDRGMESALNRKIYSVVDNVSKRVTANLVVGSISSALNNFIPITQSWGEVNPKWTLAAMGDTLRNIRKDDGLVEKSDFLTNRLRTAENLYKSGWDKAADKAAFLMNAVDSFTSQVVWRSKYRQNLQNGMSENAAIQNADQFAENVIAGRSRGNMPTVFDAKNPLVKVFTAFQLEVNNQYGYMFKDMPTDMQNKSKARLLGGYLGMFIGAHAYNALYSSLTGRDAAFDPIGILMELFNDLGFGDDDEEETDIVGAGINLLDNVLEDTPFIGGLMGGGRIPISSALPYDGVYEMLTETPKDFSEGNYGKLTSEWLNPLYYITMPFGGGQLKKTVEGLSMFDDDLPVSGSYTDSGKLRFPVDDNLWKRVQAGLFGQYASENARDYFDNGRKPLDEKQIQEFVDSGISIQDYWKYREGLSGLKTLAEKADYIYGLDIPIEAKNLFINNLSGRKEEIDLSGMDGFESFEEYDYAQSNPGKYAISKAVASDLDEYKQYSKELGAIESDKDENGKTVSGSRKEKVVKYINDLDLDYGQKIILYRSQYKSDNTYNYEIVDYLNGRDDISYETMVAILKELGFTVKGNSVTWD